MYHCRWRFHYHQFRSGKCAAPCPDKLPDTDRLLATDACNHFDSRLTTGLNSRRIIIAIELKYHWSPCPFRRLSRGWHCPRRDQFRHIECEPALPWDYHSIHSPDMYVTVASGRIGEIDCSGPSTRYLAQCRSPSYSTSVSSPKRTMDAAATRAQARPYLLRLLPPLIHIRPRVDQLGRVNS